MPQSFYVAAMVLNALLCLSVQIRLVHLVRLTARKRREAGQNVTRTERLADLSTSAGLAAIIVIGLTGYWLVGPIWTILLLGTISLLSDQIPKQYGSVWKGILLEWEENERGLDETSPTDG